MAASFVQSLNVGAVNALVTGHRTTVRVPSLLSVAGALVGLLVMTVLVPSLSVTGVALGFLSSTLVSGFGPLVVVWRLHRMRWSALSLRMVAGAAVVIALAVLARLWDSHGLLSDVLSAVIFVLVWLSLMLREAKLLYGALG
jgi:putative peptidoglycan lipid II flippase